MVDNRLKILVLNSDYQPLTLIPLSTINWQEAIKMVFLNDATILEYIKGSYVRSEKLKMNLPSVVILNRYVKNNYKVKLTRTNLFIRDFYTCRFCGSFLFFEKEKLTIDHIIPRSKGGKSSWENLVSSCRSCNGKKGDKIIFPDSLPKKPSYSELVGKRKKLPIYIDHESWKKYLYEWDEKNIFLRKIPV